MTISIEWNGIAHIIEKNDKAHIKDPNTEIVYLKANF